MHTKKKTRFAFVTGLLVALSLAGVAAAQAAPQRLDDGPDGAVAAEHVPVVEQQRGIVVEASGTAAGITASVTVYENARYGNSVQVVLGEDVIGYDEGTTAYLVGGTLHATVSIDGRPAVVSGTLTEDGRPEKVVEPVQDAGEQIVTRGTHTSLVGELTLTRDGVVVPLHLDTAFAYDLETRRVALYGG